MKEAIKSILREHAGQDRAITVAQIVEAIGEIPDGPTNPSARATIRKVIDSHELPIGSCSKGYYLIQNPEELKEYCKSLLDRADSIKERAVNTYHSYVKYYKRS